MKILIVPLITAAKTDAAWHIARTISDLFSARQHICAISGPVSADIASAALYDAAPLKKPLFYNRSCFTYEEWLYGFGALSREYLSLDTECVLNAIDHFRPDIIICIDRIAAVIAARARGIPCIPVINTAMYRTGTFPVKVLQGANQVLSEYGFEQVFRLHTLYDRCLERVIFGAIQSQPLPMETNAKRFGTIASIRPVPDKPEGVFIYFSQIDMKASALRKIVLETFNGAHWPVHALIKDVAAEKQGNVHFLAAMREDILANCTICIHDGNEYISQICAADGIPQLIVSDHRYGRTANALAARRYGYGILMDEDELSVASLYENYRRMVSDPDIYEAASEIRSEIISLGDFEDFYRFMLAIVRR